jgi:hypothetical protein
MEVQAGEGKDWLVADVHSVDVKQFISGGGIIPKIDKIGLIGEQVYPEQYSSFIE